MSLLNTVGKCFDRVAQSGGAQPTENQNQGYCD